VTLTHYIQTDLPSKAPQRGNQSNFSTPSTYIQTNTGIIHPVDGEDADPTVVTATIAEITRAAGYTHPDVHPSASGREAALSFVQT
jgi:hypothetical protein